MDQMKAPKKWNFVSEYVPVIKAIVEHGDGEGGLGNPGSQKAWGDTPVASARFSSKPKSQRSFGDLHDNASASGDGKIADGVSDLGFPPGFAQSPPELQNGQSAGNSENHGTAQPSGQFTIQVSHGC